MLIYEIAIIIYLIKETEKNKINFESILICRLEISHLIENMVAFG